MAPLSVVPFMQISKIANSVETRLFYFSTRLLGGDSRGRPPWASPPCQKGSSKVCDKSLHSKTPAIAQANDVLHRVHTRCSLRN